MSKPDTCELAFPSHGTMGEVVREGMTLRQWYAGQALIGILSKEGMRMGMTGEDIAVMCFDMADAMIELEP